MSRDVPVVRHGFYWLFTDESVEGWSGFGRKGVEVSLKMEVLTLTIWKTSTCPTLLSRALI